MKSIKHRIEFIALSEVRGWPRNPKRHAGDAIRESITRFGFIQPLVIDDGTKRLVAGHGRVDELIRLRESGKNPPPGVQVAKDDWYIPVVRGIKFKDEREAEAYLLADNQTTILGGWDNSVLAELLGHHQMSLDGLGWTTAEVESLVSIYRLPEATERQAAIQASPVRWLGGKHFLVTRLLPLIPTHRTYVEVFGGGAHLLLAKEPSEVEVYNDRSFDLANLFFVLKSRPFKLIRRCQELPYSRQLYKSCSEELHKQQAKLGDLERAVKFFYAVRCSFPRGVGAGWAFGPTRSHPKAYRSALQLLDRTARRLENVAIDNVDFRSCVKNWDSPDTFFYIDPPYWETTEYDTKFTWQDHIDLANLLKRVRGRWLLTIGDHPDVRKLYGNYAMRRAETPLASEKVIGPGSRSKYTHLILSNYPLLTHHPPTYSLGDNRN